MTDARQISSYSSSSVCYDRLPVPRQIADDARQQRVSFLAAPDEIVLCILWFLDVDDLLATSRVSGIMHNNLIIVVTVTNKQRARPAGTCKSSVEIHYCTRVAYELLEYASANFYATVLSCILSNHGYT